MKRGTQVPCSSLLPSYYKINEVWYKIMTRPTETLTPAIIQSQMANNWEYKDPASLATSGIYTERDLSKLRERINFPMEKPAFLNVLARGMAGIPMTRPDDTIVNLFEEKALEKLADSAWDKAWQKFMNFGTVSAAVLGVIFIVQANAHKHDN